MNKKQLIIAWIFGIYLAFFLSLFALKYYVEHHLPINLLFHNGHILTEARSLFLGHLAPDCERTFGSINYLL